MRNLVPTARSNEQLFDLLSDLKFVDHFLDGIEKMDMLPGVSPFERFQQDLFFHDFFRRLKREDLLRNADLFCRGSS